MSVRTSLAVQPHLYIGDAAGRPLDYGRVFFGEPDKDPEFYPINIYYDEALTIPAMQPVRSKGGFLNANGDMIEIYAKELEYSVKVLDQYGVKVFYKSRMSKTNSDDSISTRLTHPDAVARTQSEKNADIISVKDFGAKGDGVADDTAAIQNAILYASTVVQTAKLSINTVAATVIIPSGTYKLTDTVILANSVQMQGSGSGSALFNIHHNGVGFKTPDTIAWLANIHLTGFKISNKGSGVEGNIGIQQSKTIRNCYMFDVVVEDFYDNFVFSETWTHKIEQCMGLRAKRHNIYGGTATGGLHIYGGRYDAAASHSVYINSVSAEVIMQDVASQFSNRSGLRVDDCYTVETNQCFFEGNCIDSVDDYHVYIKPPTLRSLSSASVINCVINNTGAENRDGKGILFVDNIKSFTYKERWVRNGVSTVPEVGTNVQITDMLLANAADKTKATANIKRNAISSATVKQLNRPYAVYGRDMSEVSFSPNTYAALNAGYPDVGIALGTYNYSAAMQSYGDSYKLTLNPNQGDIYLGNTGLCKVASGSNEYHGRFAHTAQITSSNIKPLKTTGLVIVDTTGGTRTVDLSNLSADYGRVLVIVKTDSSANTLIVTAKSGELINGAASASLTTKAALSLIGLGGEWLSF
ncbi:glycosyl hydrolase family 28-related protein [Psychrobacter pygoscelis]|uniref:glycosyl hydrolase family 28-related protein n=1 Tax=Psychrobacter pygoscelis TaxID=2488563 RepID=UPI0010397806|nr:glycosyl hydrolase family 28-related protein [Psychrobacter pygoscelis]